MAQLTVLTDPIPSGTYYITERAKKIGRRVRNILSPTPLYLRSKYRGHFAVTRSLIEGLESIGVSANYNPHSTKEIGESVVVLSGILALRQAILWKRTGRIKRLLAGPNLVCFPYEHNRIICSPEIDLCIVPSDWVAEHYVQECPELLNRCVIWAAGVDTTYWIPALNCNTDKNVLLFEKQSHGPVGPISNYLSVLKRYGYNVDLIVYGQYQHRDYLHALQRSIFLVGFVAEESQGIAWAESWSTNVPTLLWYQEYNTHKGWTFRSSTAPYLNPQTGYFFTDILQLEDILNHWGKYCNTFQPRRWVLKHMSDEVCARKLCEFAGIPLRE